MAVLDQTDPPGTRRVTRRRWWFLVAIVALLLPALVTVTALVRLWTPTMADGVTAQQFGDAGTAFTVIPARSWSIHTAIGPVDYVVLSSPDGRLTVTLRAERTAPDADAVGARTRTRRLPSGGVLVTKETSRRIEGTLDFGSDGAVAINAWTGLEPIARKKAAIDSLISTLEPAS